MLNCVFLTDPDDFRIRDHIYAAQNFRDFERSGRFSHRSRKLNTFFRHLPSAGRQNRVQNRNFSENPRWGPDKNHKNVTKYRSTPGNC